MLSRGPPPPLGETPDQARERQMANMRNFSRQVHARIANLAEFGYNTRHGGTAANPIVLPEDDNDNSGDAVNEGGEILGVGQRENPVVLDGDEENDHVHGEQANPIVLDSSDESDGESNKENDNNGPQQQQQQQQQPVAYDENNGFGHLNRLELLAFTAALIDELDEDDAPEEEEPLLDEQQIDPAWPVRRSRVRDEPLPAHALLPVPMRAPPGPTEANFVYADERDEYLARCPPNMDFSQIVFMPGPRPNSSTNENTTTAFSAAGPRRRPAPPVLLAPAEAAHLRDLFVAKNLALRAARRSPPSSPLPLIPSSSPITTTPPPPTPSSSSVTTTSPTTNNNNMNYQQFQEQLLEQLPHLDAEDDSQRSHYAQCEVCRGIRRRAVPAGHEYWARLAEATAAAEAETARGRRGRAGAGVEEGVVTRSVRRGREM